ncbi:tetratricopeptide repeat protein [Marinicella gelatinilytica]|uniref:tetratricopeptide repeat protein n=1 Tax=Marinicella gelatinilytica TaxID=2996017 RepID=UPI0022609ACA|nr:tetratricopeptide repeat protein [Marinicella gelatinilytica]MCX7544788.1 tetratricopeptide repeat protein [Marinicella gelatinilytica]
MTACQSPSPKTTQNGFVAIEQSVWEKSQKQVIDNIRDRQFELAASQLEAMISGAGDEDSHWQYIRMILAVLPAEYATPLITQASQQPQVQQSSDHLLGFSRLFMRHNEVDKAITIAQQAVALDKSETTVHWQARLLSVNQNFLAAEQDYQWLLSQSPANVDYISQYAALKMQQNQLQAAEDLLKNHSDEPRLLYQYILILLQQEKMDSAKDQYKTLKSLITDQALTAEEKLDYGEVAMWLDDYDTALTLLNEIKDAEHIYPAKLLLGRVYMAQKNPERAMVLFKQVQNAPQQHAIPAFQMVAEFHHSQGDLEKAITEISEGLRFFKEQPDLLYFRALIYAEQNNVTDAERDLRTIIEQDPEHADALNALGYTWADNDMNLDLALDYISQANELKPNNSAILDSMGWVHFKRGDLLKAEHYLREALAQSNYSEETYEHLIEVLEAQNKSQEADFIRQKQQQRQSDKP